MLGVIPAVAAALNNRPPALIGPGYKGDAVIFGRASVAYDVDADGRLTEFATNQLRNGETLVNRTLNPRAEGALAGSPGTLPDGWTATTTGSGITREVVGSGIEEGISYVDVRFFATATVGAQAPGISPQANTALVAAPGEVWSASGNVRLVAGSLSGITSMVYLLRARNAAGVSIGTLNTTIAPTGAGLGTQRALVNGYTLPALTAFVQHQVLFNVADGGAFDLTLRVGGVQIEKSPAASPLTLPPPGTQQASYRAASRTVTNLVTNPSGEGAVVGVVGSGGSQPTGWSPWGIFSREIIGQQVIDGIPCTLIRFFGPASSTGANEFFPQGNVAIAIGDTYVPSVYLAVVGGTWPATLSTVNVRLAGEAGGESILPTATLTRYGVPRVTNVGLGRTVMRINSADTTTNVDFTIAVGGWQLEKATVRGPLALPAPGTTGVSTTQVAVTPPGILIEGTATNVIRNGTAAGLVAGSPGTPPATWGAITQSSGLTRTLAAETRDGVSGMRVTWTGTTSAPVLLYVQPEGSVHIAASVGQVWTHSFYAQVVQDDPAVTALECQLIENDSGGAFLAGNSASFYAGRAGFARAVYTRTLLSATVAFARPSMATNTIASGVAVNFSIFLGGFQLETGSIATSLIPTNGTAVTRAGDSAVVSGASFERMFAMVSVTNLLTYSEQFDNAVWTKLRATIAANATTAPDGASTADKLVLDATATNSHSLSQITSFVAGQSYTFTAYAKAAELNNLRLSLNFPAFTSGTIANFNLLTGAASFIGPGTLANAVSVGNGWWRVSIIATANTTATSSVGLLLVSESNGSQNFDGDGVSGVFVWGAMVETTPATLAAGNLITNPEAFEQALWSKTAVTIVPNVSGVVAPDGSGTADKLAEDATTSGHYVGQGFNATVDLPYVFSVYVCAAERPAVQLILTAIGNGGGNALANFDLSGNGVATGVTGAVPTITPVGNGWYLCQMLLTAGATAIGGTQIRPLTAYAAAGSPASFAGTAGSGLYIWGATVYQVASVAAVPTYVPLSALVSPYVATTATAATKTGAKEGWVIVDVLLNQTAAPVTQYIAQIDDGASNNRQYIYNVANSSSLTGRTTVNGVAQGAPATAGSVTPGVAFRFGMRWVGAAFSICKDGATIQSSISLLPLGLATLRLGNAHNGVVPLNGRILGVRTGSRRLSDAEFQFLCTPGK